MSKVIAWIDDIRASGQKVIKQDLEKCIKQLERGNSDGNKFHLLLQEIRDNERDDALLSLVKSAILEEVKE